MPGLREIFSGTGTHRKRDAAIGAAAGSFLGPIGTIAGGALGGWFGGRSDDKIPTINSGNTLPPPSLNLPGTSLPQMSTSTPPVTFGGTPPPATSTLGGPVDTSGLAHPTVPSMVPTVVGPDGKAANSPWLMDSTGRYNSPNGPTYSANEDEQKKSGYWGSAAYQNTGSSNPFWGGQGGGGAPTMGGGGVGWNIPGFASAPTVYAVGNHGIK